MRLPSVLHIPCNLVDAATACLQCQKMDMRSSKVKPPARMAQHSPMAFPVQMVFLVMNLFLLSDCLSVSQTKSLCHAWSAVWV